MSKANQSGRKLDELKSDAIMLMKHLDELVYSASAITGFPLPTNKTIEKLIEELLKFLSDETYGDLTINEILLSFRLINYDRLRYPSGLEVEYPNLQGSHISVHYVARILNIYLSIRNYILQELQILAEKNA